MEVICFHDVPILCHLAPGQWAGTMWRNRCDMKVADEGAGAGIGIGGPTTPPCCCCWAHQDLLIVLAKILA